MKNFNIILDFLKLRINLKKLIKIIQTFIFNQKIFNI